jgi:hypothetical protein
MNSIVRLIGKIILWVLAIFGVLFIAIIIYYYPVIDRLYVRPCYYYPKAFADCN